MAQGPREATRWTLERILAHCPWLKLKTLAGVHKVLKRVGIAWLRGREYVHSPDVDYGSKVAYIKQCLQLAQADPQGYVLVYLDEFSFYRQPTLANDYGKAGQHWQPRAHRAYRSNTICRGLGAVNILTGQLTYLQASHITTKRLVQFYTLLTQAYPQAHTIFVVQDNWAVHFHPEVLAAVHTQVWPFPLLISHSWSHLFVQPMPSGNLPIQMLFLPSYAPWLNPIEKLWRFVRQQVLHLHRFADDWLTLKQRVWDFMMQFQLPSTRLLRYLGLLPY